MDYFALYRFPPTLRPDAAAVKARYYALSRQYHPDRFATAPPAEATDALRTSSAVNEAYRTFSDPDRTLAYALRTAGVLEEEEKYALPPAFLMEMMDLNEAVDEAAPGSMDAAQAALADALGSWTAHYKPLADRYDAGERSPELLADLKDAYFRKKYLARIAGRLNTFTSSL